MTTSTSLPSVLSRRHLPVLAGKSTLASEVQGHCRLNRYGFKAPLHWLTVLYDLCLPCCDAGLCEDVTEEKVIVANFAIFPLHKQSQLFHSWHLRIVVAKGGKCSSCHFKTYPTDRPLVSAGYLRKIGAIFMIFSYE